MKRQQIIFVNRFAYPDISATSQILNDLARALAVHHEVLVISSRLRYDGAKDFFPAFDIWNAVKIHRVWTSRFGRGSILGRTVDYLTFFLSAFTRTLQLATRNSIVVAMTDPPMISVSVSIAVMLRGAKLVNWIQDLFPEAAIALGVAPRARPIIGILKAVRNHTLRNAATNVSIGKAMNKLVVDLAPHVPAVEIHNWSPGAAIEPIQKSANPLAEEWGFKEKFVVGYSGNFGRAHELLVVLETAEALGHRPDIVFLLIGDGAQKKKLLQESGSRKLTNIVFKPYQAFAALPYSLSLPDIHLVSLKPVLEGLIVPSKFYSSIAAGRPVIFIGAPDGEIASMIATGRCGLTFAPNGGATLAKAIERLCDNPADHKAMSVNARRLFEQDFEQTKAILKWEKLLAGLSVQP